MSMTADKGVAEALGLSPQARAFVAERLIESLDAAHILSKKKGTSLSDCCFDTFCFAKHSATGGLSVSKKAIRQSKYCSLSDCGAIVSKGGAISY